MKNVSITLMTTLSLATLLTAGCGGSKSSGGPASDPTVTTQTTNEGLLIGTWRLDSETPNPNQAQTVRSPRILQFTVDTQLMNTVRFCDQAGSNGTSAWKYIVNGRRESQLLSPLGRVSFEYFDPSQFAGPRNGPSINRNRFDAKVTVLNDRQLEFDGRIRYVRVADGVGKFEDLCNMRNVPSRPRRASMNRGDDGPQGPDAPDAPDSSPDSKS